MPYAHSRNAQGKRQLLEDHLKNVANLAEEFAKEFGSSEIAHYLGLWHDLGKLDPAFQEYLLLSEANPGQRFKSIDHKAVGAHVASKPLGLLALAIQGHHGGLQNPQDFVAWLAEHSQHQGFKAALEEAQPLLRHLTPSAKLAWPDHTLHNPHAAELFLRLVYSALVDADALDTEEHFSPDRSQVRYVEIEIGELWKRFESNQLQVTEHAQESVVNRARREIYAAALSAAEAPTGLFRLNVPTGGGKTRSAMAFALRHALRNGLGRVIVAVPFITITEQTADVYRGIFGEDKQGRSAVLEHHSSADYWMSESENDTDYAGMWPRLAAENWDAPIIVTTTVQLFQSLFAANPSRMRKVHRLARSVIILDEAQALPSHVLEPLLDGLRELCAHYGSSVVLSTATQPAFECLPPFAALPAIEVVSEPKRYFSALKRVRYDWQIDRGWSWEEVAELLRKEPQALVVLNTKNDAQNLLRALNDPGALHLSTLLCGAHRRAVIAEVRNRLANNEPCRLISTQVVQAGVDLDFPLVLRAMGPLDGIIQAAGRCNREGQRLEGKVIVFRPAEGRLPPGFYRTATEQTEVALGGGPVDLDDPTVARRYFQLLYPLITTDREGIQAIRAGFDFPEVARRFRMIEDDNESVVVAYGSDEEQERVGAWLDELRQKKGSARKIMRLLQPYIVNIRRQQAEHYRGQSLIDSITPGLGQWLGAYDPVCGLTGADPGAEALILG